MKVLSVQQPYAWLIVHGIKKIENRTWCPSYRGPFHVHASQTLYGTREERERLRSMIRKRFAIDMPSDDDLERGGIIGAATLVDVVRFAPERPVEITPPPRPDTGSPAPDARGAWRQRSARPSASISGASSRRSCCQFPRRRRSALKICVFHNGQRACPRSHLPLQSRRGSNASSSAKRATSERGFRSPSPAHRTRS